VNGCSGIIRVIHNVFSELGNDETKSLMSIKSVHGTPDGMSAGPNMLRGYINSFLRASSLHWLSTLLLKVCDKIQHEVRDGTICSLGFWKRTGTI
jgi:hypothetical protein